MKNHSIVNIPGYQSPCITTTEAEKGGRMIYVKNGINYKVRKSLESTFVELINNKESNCIVGVICRHLNMNTSLFTDNKLSDLLVKLSYENNKKVYLTGDFNFDLLKISSNTDTSTFYEKVISNLLFPIITLQTKINENNNIFTNQFNRYTISANLTVNISDHLSSLLLKLIKTIYPKKQYIYTRDLNHFDREHFILDIVAIDWNSIIVNDNADLSFNRFHDTINKVIDRYMHLKKLSYKDFKRKFKPWITHWWNT